MSVAKGNDLPFLETITAENNGLEPLEKNLETSSIVPEDKSPALTRVDMPPPREVIAIPGPSSTSDTTTPVKKSMDVALGIIVPSPFKRCLFWPEDDINKKKRRIKKEKIPAAVTSKAWREYHVKKDNEKKKQLEEKEERARKRQEKKC